MRSGTIAFSLGALALLWVPALPDPLLVQFLPVVALLAWRSPAARFPALFLCGFLWALLRTAPVMLAALPAELAGRDVLLRGEVVGLPEKKAGRVRFIFRADRVANSGVNWRGGRVRVNWYGAAPNLAAGERWRLNLRLVPPRGFANPGGFDYSKWLFSKGIRATGYVRSSPDNRRISHSSPFGVTATRLAIANRLDQILELETQGGIIRALAVGDRGGLGPNHWRVLRNTGTAHLMAISGLHIGLVAGFGFFAARRVWHLSAGVFPGTPAVIPGAIVGFGLACIYAGLAGFTVPTQRALVMVGVVMAALLLRRRVSPSTALALALGVVIILDPASLLSVGFWLSFSAVAVILGGFQGHFGGYSAWRRMGQVQLLVTVGLFPLMWLFFQQQAGVAPLANLVAVPWMGLVVVPLGLVGSALLFPFPVLGKVLVVAAAYATSLLWPFLQWLSDQPLLLTAPISPGPLAVLAALVGVAVLLAPRGIPHRWLGIFWMLPLLFGSPPRPALGSFEFTLLDVGQGLAAVIRTRNHSLVYDTGPRYRFGFDAGQAVIAPYLRSVGVRTVSRVLISHGDNDHAGGLAGLAGSIPIQQLFGPVSLPEQKALPCHKGLHWDWDGVHFEALSPETGGPYAGNNGSCLLRISGAGGSVLLTGDLEAEEERRLVATAVAGLQADVIQVPHHGSDTSSTEEFIHAVSPRVALISAGFRNRFGFPHSVVLARYRRTGARTFNTANSGALTVTLAPESGISVPTEFRLQQRRLWHGPGPSDQSR